MNNFCKTWPECNKGRSLQVCVFKTISLNSSSADSTLIFIFKYFIWEDKKTLYLLFYIFIYLFGWARYQLRHTGCLIFVAAYRIFSCGMWRLVSSPGIEPRGTLHWKPRVLATGLRHQRSPSTCFLNSHFIPNNFNMYYILSTNTDCIPRIFTNLLEMFGCCFYYYHFGVWEE